MLKGGSKRAAAVTSCRLFILPERNGLRISAFGQWNLFQRGDESALGLAAAEARYRQQPGFKSVFVGQGEKAIPMPFDEPDYQQQAVTQPTQLMQTKQCLRKPRRNFEIFCNGLDEGRS